MALPFAPGSISIFNPLFSSVNSASLLFPIYLFLYILTATSSGLNLPMFLNYSLKQLMLQNAASIISLKSAIKFMCSKTFYVIPVISLKSIFIVSSISSVLISTIHSPVANPAFLLFHTYTTLFISAFCSYCLFSLACLFTLPISTLPLALSSDILSTYKGHDPLL